MKHLKPIAKLKDLYGSKRFNVKGALVFAGIFGFIGVSLLTFSRAAGPSVSVELESASVTSPAITGSDATASGGQYVQFKPASPPPPPPPPGGSMPTPSNTGPLTNPAQTMTANQFLSTRACDNKRIIDQVRIDTNGLGGYAGATLTLTNCVLEQGWIWNEDSYTYPLSQYPTINMTNVTINGSFVTSLAFNGTWDKVKITNGWQLAACGSCALSNFGVTREAPFTVTNSYIATPPIPASTGCQYHSEAFHGIGGISKYSFLNTRFVQEGTGTDPFAYCHTGTIYQQGGGGVTYDGCYFDDGDPAQQNTYFFTINIDGNGTFASQNIVKNSFIEKGGAYATNPAGGAPATYTNNFDFNTRAPIN